MASSLGHALSVTHTNFKNRGENRLTSILYTKQKPFCTALIRPRVVNIRLFYFGAFRQFILVKYNTLLWWKQFDFFSVCFCFVSHKISMLKFGLPGEKGLKHPELQHDQVCFGPMTPTDLLFLSKEDLLFEENPGPFAIHKSHYS